MKFRVKMSADRDATTPRRHDATPRDAAPASRKQKKFSALIRHLFRFSHSPLFRFSHWRFYLFSLIGAFSANQSCSLNFLFEDR
jgi:hypothetical protein